jgi:chromosome segregation ATPase
MERQLPDVNSQLTDLNNELKSKQDEKKKLDKKKAGITNDITSLELELSAYKANIQNAENNVRKAKRDAENKEKLVKSLKDELSKRDSELEKKRLEAEEGTMKLIKTVEDGGGWDGQPLELGKSESADNIKKEIEKLKKKEEEEKKKHGLQGRTEAEVLGRYRNAKADYDTSKNEYASLQERLVHLEADYKKRKVRWHNGLRDSTETVKEKFDKYLGEKGLSGTLKFSHTEETLHIITRTDSTDKNTTCSDVSQLSGGEKSYTTLSLLLALGHTTECPFRLMDEYDVFMDEGSRQLSLDMLTKYSLKPSQISRQFIIITPNNLNHVISTDKIKIIQMQPPDRRERSAAGGPRQRTLEETF